MRLTKIYTRNGDQGKTCLADGTPIDKDALQIHAIGEVDELNCALGVLISLLAEQRVSSLLEQVQQLLFELGAELALPLHPRLCDEDVKHLEHHLDQLNAELPPLKEFILPGGSLVAAHCQLARAICRRAERSLISLQRQQTLNPQSVCFINRLSDFLFVLARSLNLHSGQTSPLWQPRQPS